MSWQRIIFPLHDPEHLSQCYYQVQEVKMNEFGVVSNGILNFLKIWTAILGWDTRFSWQQVWRCHLSCCTMWSDRSLPCFRGAECLYYQGNGGTWVNNSFILKMFHLFCKPQWSFFVRVWQWVDTVSLLGLLIISRIKIVKRVMKFDVF